MVPAYEIAAVPGRDAVDAVVARAPMIRAAHEDIAERAKKPSRWRPAPEDALKKSGLAGGKSVAFVLRDVVRRTRPGVVHG